MQKTMHFVLYFYVQKKIHFALRFISKNTDSTNSVPIVRGTRVFQPDFFCWTSLSVASGTKCAHVTESITKDEKGRGRGKYLQGGRTITIMARTGTSGTATATGTIPILYGFFIPLILSNWTSPRTEPWLGWERRPGKILGCSREVDIMKVRCRRTRSRRSVSTMTTMTTMITTCATDRADSLLRDLKGYAL